MKIILILFMPLITFAQKKCSGIVIDRITGSRIPYAAIGLIKENKGINANEDGSFSIVPSFPQTDSLRISSVGYKALLLPVSTCVNEGVVMLQQEIRELKEVIVSNRSKQTFILNKFRKCSWSIYKIGLNTISQLAQRFNAPAQGMQLTALELCKDDSESKFRIRIYDIDSTYKYPSNDLVDSVIEVTSKEGHVRINLEDYNIIIPGKSFFIAIEWLYIPFNIQLKKEKINGRRIVQAWYKPQIKLIEREQNAINEDIWELSFMGRWANRWVSKGVNFQITAELR
ncbi:MAG: carboxypeptidase-like regulatory domain-containing protein [Bacteroidia bacterium]|nr:carboxypeptidase-like regulatory domain-containing protein [Bacteroidia bacterium]